MAVGGIHNFAAYLREHHQAFRGMVGKVERVFNNTILALREFGKFVKEGLYKLIEEGINLINDILKETIPFLKRNTGFIFCSTSTGASTGAFIVAARTLLSSGVQTALVGTIVEHCVVGGVVGLGTGIFFALGKEVFCYFWKRRKNKKIQNLMLTPEIDAEEAERRGLEQIQLKVQELIESLDTIVEQEKQRRGRADYALEYSETKANLLKMQKKIPKVTVIET
jgi:hypothetical protein